MLRTLMDRVEQVVAAIAATLLMAFTVIILADVFCRYWLHIPLAWAAELTVLLFQWSAMLGATLALRKGVHFGLDLGFAALPPPLGRGARWLVLLVVTIANVLLVGVSITMIDQARFSHYPTLPVSHAAVYMAVLVSAGLMLVFTLEQAVTGPPRKDSKP